MVSEQSIKNLKDLIHLEDETTKEVIDFMVRASLEKLKLLEKLPKVSNQDTLIVNICGVTASGKTLLAWLLKHILMLEEGFDVSIVPDIEFSSVEALEERCQRIGLDTIVKLLKSKKILVNQMQLQRSSLK